MEACHARHLPLPVIDSTCRILQPEPTTHTKNTPFSPRTMHFLPSFTAVSLTLLALILSSLVVRLHILPLLLRTFTQVRVSSFSLLSVRGLEWRTKHGKEDIIPVLRVERARWTWGGIKGDVTGLFVLRIEGISWRIKKRPSGDTKNEGPSVKHRVSDRSISATTDHTTKYIDAKNP